MNFGQTFREIRTRHKLSMGDVAKRCDLHPSTIWKTEIGIQLVRPKTMRLMCLKGLGLTEKSPEWKELHTAWMIHRSGSSTDPADLAKELSLDVLRNNAAATEFFKNVSKLSDDDFAQVAKAVTRPAVLDLIRAANSLYEASGSSENGIPKPQRSRLKTA